MRLGINPLPWVLDTTFHLDEPSLRDGFRAVADAGFRAVHADIPDPMSVADYSALLVEYDLDPAPGYFSGAFETGIPADAARRAAARHAELGLDTMFIAGKFAAQRDVEPASGANFDRHVLMTFISNLASACREIRAEGVTPMLHPHVGTLVEVESEIRMVLDSIEPGLLGFGPDTGHLRWAEADIDLLIADYSDRIFGAHIKDVDPVGLQKARRSHADYWKATREDHVWTEPGRGDVDLERALEALVICPLAQWLVVEVDVPNLPSATASTLASAEWARSQPLLRASMRSPR